MQDRQTTDVDGGASLSLGRLNLSTSGTFNRSSLEEVSGYDLGMEVLGPCADDPVGGLLGLPCIVLPGGHDDEASWNASIGYQQDLIGQTTLTPNLGFSQEIRRDSLTSDEYLAAPLRLNFGASLSTAIFGRYGGIGPFSAISAGGYHACGLKTNGDVWCWGYNAYGEGGGAAGPLHDDGPPSLGAGP